LGVRVDKPPETTSGEVAPTNVELVTGIEQQWPAGHRHRVAAFYNRRRKETIPEERPWCNAERGAQANRVTILSARRWRDCHESLRIASLFGAILLQV